MRTTTLTFETDKWCLYFAVWEAECMNEFKPCLRLDKYRDDSLLLKLLYLVLGIRFQNPYSIALGLTFCFLKIGVINVKKEDSNES